MKSLREIKHFLKNIWKYRKFLKEDGWWEFEYFQFEVMRIKLKDFIQAFEDGRALYPVIGMRKRIKNAKIALEYLNRIQESRCPMSMNYTTKFWTDDNGFLEMDTKKRSEVVPNFNAKGYRDMILRYGERVYRQELYRLLAKHANGWWD